MSSPAPAGELARRTNEHGPAEPTREVSVAAVDLGSNSFHLIVARLVDREVHVVDKMRDRVQLAAGLDESRTLTAEAIDRALSCLERFGQRLRQLPADRVRVVGTNTLRQARNRDAFLTAAREALGHEVEIISGREEARLIYLGVAHSVAGGDSRRLVIDIGGGSTECILGEQYDTVLCDSLYMGCVSYTMRFFPDGAIDRERMSRAMIAARLELQSIQRRYREQGWSEALGSSGTVDAVEAVLRANGFTRRGITRKGLRKLRKALCAAGHADRLQLDALAADRAPVFAGGVAILSAAFEALQIEDMRVSDGALREGVVHDLLGRIQHEDERDRTIAALTERYHVDGDHARHIEHTVLKMLRQVAPSWNLDVSSGARLAGWAARLHEIGLSIAYSGYHKHSSYLVQHSDMPGFSRQDQQRLAVIVRNHRRKIKAERYRAFKGNEAKALIHLTVLLRLAILLHRDRSETSLPPFALAAAKNQLHIAFPEGWLEHHPLTRTDLEEETERLVQGTGIRLTMS